MWKKLNIPGNPYALARIVGVVVCAVVAAILFKQGDVPFAALFGSFFGAGLSLSLNWIVTTLEKPDDQNLPTELITAATKDVSAATYFRKNQIIDFSISKDADDNAATLTLKLTADLVPFDKSATVFQPRVKAPQGLTIKSQEYKVGGAPVRTSCKFDKETSDEFTLVYLINDECQNKIQDDHRWPSPVLNYKIQHNGSSGFKLEIEVRDGSFRPHSLAFKNRRNGMKEFHSKHAAFTQQGISWYLTLDN